MNTIGQSLRVTQSHNESHSRNCLHEKRLTIASDSGESDVRSKCVGVRKHPSAYMAGAEKDSLESPESPTSTASTLDRVVLTLLDAAPDSPVPFACRLRRALKVLGRSFSLRCTSISPVPPANQAAAAPTEAPR